MVAISERGKREQTEKYVQYKNLTIFT